MEINYLFSMTTKVTRRDGESGERFLKRFSSYIKSRRIIQAFRKKRYNNAKPTQRMAKQTAISREKYRAENKKREYLG